MKNFAFLRDCRQSEILVLFFAALRVTLTHPEYRFGRTWWSLRLGSSIICAINRKFFSLCIIAGDRTEQGRAKIRGVWEENGFIKTIPLPRVARSKPRVQNNECVSLTCPLQRLSSALVIASGIGRAQRNPFFITRLLACEVFLMRSRYS